jgi:hypothetical protein
MPKDKQREFYMGNQNLPVPTAQFEYTTEQAAGLAKCAENIIYFAENYFTIVSEKGKHNIELYKAQKRVLRALFNYRFNVVLQPRQTGKCQVAESIIQIRNKKTGISEKIKIGDLFKKI